MDITVTVNKHILSLDAAFSDFLSDDILAMPLHLFFLLYFSLYVCPMLSFRTVHISAQAALSCQIWKVNRQAQQQ